MSGLGGRYSGCREQRLGRDQPSPGPSAAAEGGRWCRKTIIRTHWPLGDRT